jgi:cobalt-zinc-cadmium efflux system membrane fusion protein
LILKSQTSKGYLFERKQVKVGARNEDYVEVLNANDFEPSTSFLTSGAFNLIKD